MTYLQIISKYIWASPVFLGQYGHSDDYLEGHITALIQINDYRRASRSQGMQISTLPAVLDKTVFTTKSAWQGLSQTLTQRP